MASKSRNPPPPPLAQGLDQPLIKIHEIESASAEDEELQAVRNCLASGNWEKGPWSFVMVRNELTFIGQVILRGTRIVIPKVLRSRVLELAH